MFWFQCSLQISFYGVNNPFHHLRNYSRDTRKEIIFNLLKKQRYESAVEFSLQMSIAGLTAQNERTA
jgi:hypothetical protein